MVTLNERLAYLAGLIDGEGCITLSISPNHHCHSIKVTPRLFLSMKKGDWSKNVSETLHIICIRFYTRVRKGQTEINVKGWANMELLLARIREYVIVKKGLVEKLLVSEARKSRKIPVVAEIRKTAELIDFVRAFNKGKNRRYKWTGEKYMAFYQIRLP